MKTLKKRGAYDKFKELRPNKVIEPWPFEPNEKFVNKKDYDALYRFTKKLLQVLTEIERMECEPCRGDSCPMCKATHVLKFNWTPTTCVLS